MDCATPRSDEAAAADARWMRVALDLAERGLFTTHPNPRVGCVIVAAGEQLGAGWHVRAGEAHAEVHALREAGERARGATAYVTLEPCAHHGRTPPCADALIAAGLARVVVALRDPFPAVNGSGIARLRAAGIEVEVGVLEAAARALNAGFLSRLTRHRPWIRVKLGVSLDGRTALADGSSQWITGVAARADVQHWRARSSGILTGIGTLLADDPRLSVRGDGLPPVQPERIILDSRGRMPADARLLAEPGPVLWVTTPQIDISAKMQARVDHIAVPAVDGRLNLARLAFALAQRGHNEILVEAGATLAGAFIAAGLVDELIWYIAPKLLGHATRPALQLPMLGQLADAQDWSFVAIDRFGDDLRLLLRPPPVPESMWLTG